MSKNSSVLNTNTNKVRYPQFEYKFKIEIRKAKGVKYFEEPEWYCVGIARNNEVIFTWENRKRKSRLIQTINNLLPGITIIDKTK